ncbi:Protein bcp1 [Sparassis crispa]|uniref:Protein BCP1 n=1 Tax=Sparassis crispa TaxID=139825 RepID=A0A401G8Z1_9APHY|nr:Protein bcp1 [Sparassis crispa]GBE78634.1 Protein bcp1 [Sparassis crispa]
MAKRKQQAADADSDSDDDSHRSLVDVDFEFFDPNPDIDYLALKRLLVQLFQADAEYLQINDFADLVLSQPLVGTTVKCDGRESDPYAFLTVLNFHVHQSRPSMRAVIDYALAKSSADPAFHTTLQGLLGPAGLSSQNHVGLIFSERLINMPVEIVPHMYRMLADEIQWAVDDNEPYRFTHLLFVSRIYRLSQEEQEERQGTAPRSKRQKQAPTSAPSTPGLYPFHPEDECIQKFAVHSLDYAFPHAQPREDGLDLGGRMMLVPANRLRDLVAALADSYPSPS